MPELSHTESESNDDATGRPQSVAPTLKLSSRGLVLSLMVMAGAGLSVYTLFPSQIGGPELPVSVQIDRQPVPVMGREGAVLAEVVIVKNLTDHEIAKLSVDINHQYLYLQNSPLPANESVTVPQRMFTDKRSSQRFRPEKYSVKEITVTGQLPSGARGITKFEFRDASDAHP